MEAVTIKNTLFYKFSLVTPQKQEGFNLFTLHFFSYIMSLYSSEYAFYLMINKLFPGKVIFVVVSVRINEEWDMSLTLTPPKLIIFYSDLFVYNDLTELRN